jgi:hypothetical protein
MSSTSSFPNISGTAFAFSPPKNDLTYDFWNTNSKRLRDSFLVEENNDFSEESISAVSNVDTRFIFQHNIASSLPGVFSALCRIGYSHLKLPYDNFQQ